MSKVIFEGLHPECLQHPMDKKAIEIVKKLKGFETLNRKILELGFEKIDYLACVSGCLEVSKEQCSDIYSIVEESAEILDVEIPHIFVENSPYINAWTSGYTKPYIVLTSALIEKTNNKELAAIIGHELGHIKCGHVLYLSVASNLKIFLKIIEQTTLGLSLIFDVAFQSALLEWQRKAEYSADRASLLVTQDVDVTTNVMLKLASGLNQEFNNEAFLHQNNKLEHLIINDKLSNLYYLMLNAKSTHPWLTNRANELVLWSKSEEYTQILSGNYAKIDKTCKDMKKTQGVDKATSVSCTKCGKMNKTGGKFCTYCWAEIK